MRLTKKLKPPYEQVLGKDYVYTSETRLTQSFSQVEQKLGQIEDLEEELGIELVTLVKAMKNGIYAYDHANNIDHMEILSTFYGTKDMECRTDFDGDIFEYDFADYGKTWALTKEELEK